MRHYIFTKEKHTHTRSYNVCITVYRIKNNVPSLLGISHHNTAAWHGDRASACSIIMEKEKHHVWLEKDYTLKNIKLHSV